MGHGSKIQLPVLTVVVSENGINQPHVELTEGPCVLFANPAIVFLHALHVLRENDTDKLADEFFGMLVEEIYSTWRWAARNGLILLDKYISTGQRAQEAKPFYIFGQACVEPIHADKFHIVFAAESRREDGVQG